MNEILQIRELILYAFKSLLALFIIVDPIGNVPIFLVFIEKYSENERKEIVKNSVTIAMIALLAFMIFGQYILSVLDISMSSLKIAGGLLLIIIAVEMLFGRKSRTEHSDEIEEEMENIEITPLAIPLLTGPGAITLSMVLYSFSETILHKIILIIDIFLVFFLSYIILSRSEVIFKIIGKRGTKVIIRLMGLLLSAIGIEFVASGIRDFIHSL